MQICCMGELLIDFVATESGVTVGEAKGFEKKPGGAPANVAVAIKRHGVDSAFLTQVGNDPFGHYLAEVLQNEGIDISGLRYTDEARTMLAFVSLREDGERSFQFYRHPSADMLLTPEDIAMDVIDASDVFHFGSITMIGNPSREATLAAARHARDMGKLISYDPNLRMVLWPDETAAREGMRLGLEYAHVVKISEDELGNVLNPDETITDLFTAFPQLEFIALTHGSGGSTPYTRNGEGQRIEGFEVKAVDTTGAGDSFMAGLLVTLLEELDDDRKFGAVDTDKVLRFANACGALATTAKGAIPALPTRAAVANFIASQKR